MNRQIITAIAILTLMTISGCASITNSKMQPVSVQTTYHDDEIEGCKCSLVNDKGSWFVTTAGSVTIQKSYGDMVVTCKKKGLPTGTASFKSSSNGGVWGNIVAGGLIGYAVDASSGAGFDYPTNISVEMGKNVTVLPPKATTTGKKNNFQQ